MTILANPLAGMGRTSLASMVGIGSSSVGVCLKMLFDFLASLRSLARIQPPCTNVSLPSALTSLIVACRSTSGVDDLTHRWMAPAPTAVVSLVSGAETYDTAEPAWGCVQFHCHCDALPQRPPPPVPPE